MTRRFSSFFILLVAPFMAGCLSVNKNSSVISSEFSEPAELLLRVHVIGFQSDGSRKKINGSLRIRSLESMLGYLDGPDREYSGERASQFLTNSNVKGVEQPIVRFYRVRTLPNNNEQGQLYICAYLSSSIDDDVDDAALIGVGYFIGGGVGKVPFKMSPIDDALGYWFSEWHIHVSTR